ARGPMLIDGRLGIVRCLEEQLEAGFLQTILIPVDSLAGILRPNMVEPRIAVAVGVAHEIVAYLVLIDLAAGLFLQTTVERPQVVTHAAADSSLLDADDLCALLGGRACSEQTGCAGSAHEHLGVDSLDNLVFGNLRLRSQPVIHRGSSLFFLRGCSRR